MPASTIHTVRHEPAYARARIDLSGFPAGTTGVQVVRRDLDTGKSQLVRGARRITVATPASDAFRLYDYEYPAGHSIRYDYYQFPDVAAYAADWTNLIEDEASFTVGLAGWQVNTGATIARSTAQFRSTPASLAITATGTGTAEAKLVKPAAFSYLGCDPATMQRFGFGSRAATAGRTVQLVVNWYDQAGVYISSSNVSQGNGTGSWSYASADVLSPAGARSFELFLQVLTPGGAGEVHYFDDVTAGPVLAALGVDSVWLKHLTRPYLSRTVRVGTYAPYEHQLRAFPQAAVRRSVPVGGGDVRGGRRFQLTLKLTAAERDDLDNLLAVGGTWLYQPPSGDTGLPRAGYVQPVRAQERLRGTPQSGDRWLDLTLDEVSAPDADLAAAAVSWDAVEAVQATWADVLLAYPTWNDVLASVADPAEVVVT